MGSADLHIHTCYSDGQPTVADLLEHVRYNTDLDVIAITDHDTIEGALEARTLAAPYAFAVIVGEEITTSEGHVVGLFLQERVAPGQSVAETVRAVHAQGGVAFAPHPFFRNGFFSNKGYYMEGIGERLLEAGMDGIEVINSTPGLEWANRRALRFARSVGQLAELGNSDAHIRQVVGKSYTRFDGRSPKDLKQAILERRTRPAFKRYSPRDLISYASFWLRVMKMDLPDPGRYREAVPAGGGDREGSAGVPHSR